MDPAVEQKTVEHLALLKKFEADIIELEAVVNQIAPHVEAVVTTLGKLQPVVAGILNVLKGLHLL